MQEVKSEANAEPLIVDLKNGRLAELIGKFPDYPCLRDRHPEAIERFINSYNAALTALKQEILP